MTKPFIPNKCKIPENLETKDFRLRMLTINDVIKDYDAVMKSIEHLQRTKPFGPHQTWPSKDLTLEQDLIDLGWHQKEFQKRSSFAFTVMNGAETTCLGCVYIYPSKSPHHDAIVILWVRQGEEELDALLFSSVKKWMKDKWPFTKVAYPGRDEPWEEFE